MCSTCGCGEDGPARVTSLVPGVPGHHPASHGHDSHLPGHDHHHRAGHDHEHKHDERVDPAPSNTLLLEHDVLAKNDGLAARNRDWLRSRNICAVNVMSSPGAGKTSLLVRTIRDLGDTRPVAVIEGDQETLIDAERIRDAGASAVQVNTGAGCHLDADMLRRGVQALDPPDGSLLFVENVGNLVCPALFDLGEAHRVVVMSVTEGDDKPLKYPQMFRAADLLVVNKSDLLPYVDFDLDKLAAQAHSLNPSLEIMALSVRQGRHLDCWYGWLHALQEGEDKFRSRP